MKNIMMLLAAALIAFGFIGCKEDEGTTLKWQNDSGVNLAEISWGSGTGTADQTWGSYTSGTGINNIPTSSTSDSKGIEVLNGEGDAVDEDGAPCSLDLSAGSGVASINSLNSASIEENADATLIIDAAKKK